MNQTLKDEALIFDSDLLAKVNTNKGKKMAAIISAKLSGVYIS